MDKEEVKNGIEATIQEQIDSGKINVSNMKVDLPPETVIGLAFKGKNKITVRPHKSKEE
jgi:hypothetical protein